MKHVKDLLRSPYTYIFLFTYVGVWLLWNQLKLPFSNPGEVVSYLPSIGYNPTNNLLRFAAAVLLPGLACGIYWWFSEHQTGIQKRLAKPRTRNIWSGLILGLSLLLMIVMGLVQGSTN